MILWQELQGFIPYNEALKLMEKNLEAVIEGTQADTIMLLEHQDVYTYGSNADPAELLNAGNMPVIATGRGGKFTYHGPGQRIIYPIIDLRPKKQDLRLYIRQLEGWIIATLAHFGIKAYLVPDRVGIWVQDNGQEAKIGAIGVRVRKWVTYHGIAVNIAPDLSKFKGIVPCGISDAPVTSLQKLGVNITMQEFDAKLKVEIPFANKHNRR